MSLQKIIEFQAIQLATQDSASPTFIRYTV